MIYLKYDNKETHSSCRKADTIDHDLITIYKEKKNT
jgi:hypothetical protein